MKVPAIDIVIGTCLTTALICLIAFAVLSITPYSAPTSEPATKTVVAKIDKWEGYYLVAADLTVSSVSQIQYLVATNGYQHSANNWSTNF
jgi:hypothetical protein